MSFSRDAYVLWVTAPAIELVAVELHMISETLAPKLDKQLFDPVADVGVERTFSALAWRATRHWPEERRAQAVPIVSYVDRAIFPMLKEQWEDMGGDPRLHTCKKLFEMIDWWMYKMHRGLEDELPGFANRREFIGQATEVFVWIVAAAAEQIGEAQLVEPLLKRVPARARPPREQWVTPEKLTQIARVLREILPTLGPRLDAGVFDAVDEQDAERTLGELARRVAPEVPQREEAIEMLGHLEAAVLSIVRDRRPAFAGKLEDCAAMLDLYAEWASLMGRVIGSGSREALGPEIDFAGDTIVALGGVLVTAARSIDEADLVQPLVDLLPRRVRTDGSTVH